MLGSTAKNASCPIAEVEQSTTGAGHSVARSWPVVSEHGENMAVRSLILKVGERMPMHRQDVLAVLSNVEDKIRMYGLHLERAPANDAPLRKGEESPAWEHMFGKQEGIIMCGPATRQACDRTE